ncbi:MAG TPA: hypothetical protein EYM49_06900 [Campylobacterales bacterium]|nr:hypothetical protein [Campylobacterales bacterium]
MFNDDTANTLSLPFAFRTTGVAPNINSNPPDDLNVWRRRANSARISFRDNSEGEIGFRYINANTGEVMGNQLPAVNGVGTYGIGQLNGLVANTLYRVRVETLFANPQNNNRSAVFRFRTRRN